MEKIKFSEIPTGSEFTSYLVTRISVDVIPIILVKINEETLLFKKSNKTLESRKG